MPKEPCSRDFLRCAALKWKPVHKLEMFTSYVWGLA